MNHEERYEEICEPRLEAMGADIKEIKYAIVGNGKPGLKLEMDRVKRELWVYRWIALAFAARFIYLLGTDLYGFFRNTN